MIIRSAKELKQGQTVLLLPEKEPMTVKRIFQRMLFGSLVTRVLVGNDQKEFCFMNNELKYYDNLATA